MMSTQHGPCSSLFVLLLLSVFYVINGEISYGEQLFATFRLREYGSFGDVTLFHVNIPPHCIEAVWSIGIFKNRRGCPKTTVNLAIQAGNLPIPNPYNTSFPPNTNIESQRKRIKISMMSDQPLSFVIGSPKAGGWYMASFLPKSEDNKIEQQGLGSDPCYYFIQPSVSYWQEQDVQTLSTHARATVRLSSEINKTTALYRFYVSSLTKTLTFAYEDCQGRSEVNGTEVIVACPVELRVRPNGLPSVQFSSPVVCDQNSSCSVQIREPVEDAWYYVRLNLVLQKEMTTANLSLGVEDQKCSDSNVQFYHVAQENRNVQTLLVSPNASLTYSQLNRSDSSSVSLDLLGDENDPELDPLNPLESFRMVTLPFSGYRSELASQDPPVSPSWCPPVIPLSSVRLGGTNPFKMFLLNTPNTTNLAMVPPDSPVVVSFEVDRLQDIGGNFLIKAQITKMAEEFEEDYDEDASITLCLSPGALPPLNGTRISCDPSYSVTFTNKTASSMFPWIIPFPASGVWYLSLESRCISSAGKMEACIETAVVDLDVTMYGCIDGCSEYGKCHSSISMGVLYYYCKCDRGYQGWGCTDNSEAWSDGYFWSRLLLLTLSNLFFIFPFLLALKRRHFVPAISYFCTLLFSSFYHSCDSGGYCLMSFNTLQFCDFYAAFMSIFVTLIAMARLPATLEHVLEILGAFGMALGTTYNRFSLWAAAVPVGVGMGVLLISWSRRWYKRRACYPTTKWRWLLFILPGAAVIVTGLCLFAFLETSDNYQYVHSAWHVAMAIGVLFLLPPRERIKDDNVDLTSPVEETATYTHDVSDDNKLQKQLLGKALPDQLISYTCSETDRLTTTLRVQ